MQTEVILFFFIVFQAWFGRDNQNSEMRTGVFKWKWRLRLEEKLRGDGEKGRKKVRLVLVGIYSGYDFG